MRADQEAELERRERLVLKAAEKLKEATKEKELAEKDLTQRVNEMQFFRDLVS